MEDLPISLLTQEGHARARTGEELETFGKYASKLYLQGKCGTLSEAVVEAVKTAGLSPEQVRRVVEFTNTSAYLEKFASEGANHRVINFSGGPASFPDVIRDLNDGGGGSVYDPASHDYSLPPPDVGKMASENLARLGVLDEKLAAAFAVDEVPLKFENPLRDVYDMRDKVAGLYAEATSDISGLETRYHDLCDLMFQQVKQASLEGVPLGHLLRVLGTVTEDPDFFKTAFAVLGPRLVSNGVFATTTDLANSLQKTAGAGMPNPGHPLAGIFADFCETLEKLAATRWVREELAENRDRLDVFIAKVANAEGVGRAIRGVGSIVPKAWRAATGVAAKASEPVEGFVRGLAGETPGRIAGGVVKYSPHIAAGLVAEDAYQRAKTNPAIQGATNFALARIPYTHQNMIRQYNLQMGMG